jgi:hypothetical protein
MRRDSVIVRSSCNLDARQSQDLKRGPFRISFENQRPWPGMPSVDLPATTERNRRRTTAFRSTLLCKLLGRIARIVRIAAIRGESLDELDNRIAVARFKSDESLQ